MIENNSSVDSKTTQHHRMQSSEEPSRLQSPWINANNFSSSLSGLRTRRPAERREADVPRRHTGFHPFFDDLHSFLGFARACNADDNGYFRHYEILFATIAVSSRTFSSRSATLSSSESTKASSTITYSIGTSPESLN